MRRLLFLTFFTLIFAFCTRNTTETMLVDERIYTASLEQSDTKVYLDQDIKTRWNADDRISLFNTTHNTQYKFTGNTGDRSGKFTEIGTSGKGDAVPTVYALYPYHESNFITTSGKMIFELPAVQYYAENSFGPGANAMVAVAETATSKVLCFKNLCGYIVFKLYGTGVVKSIALAGNDGEKLAGPSTVSPVYGVNPIFEVSTSGYDTVILDCGDGVALGQTAETATSFWLTLPPVTFKKGFTMTVTETSGKVMTKTVSSTKSIERNVIHGMTAVMFEPDEDVFSITPTSFDVDADGGEISFTVTSNIGYEVTNNAPEWVQEISVSEGNDATSKTYTYKVSENSETKARTGIIVVCNEHSECIPVTVKQKAGEPEEDVFSITPTSFDVGAYGGEISFTVTSNIGYEVTNNAPEWIQEISVSEGNDATSKIYSYKVSENNEAKARTGIIVVCNDHSECIPVTVKQKAGEEQEERIKVSQTDFFLESEASDFSFTIESKTKCSIKVQSEWIKEKSAEEISGQFIFSTEANPDKDAREGTILIYNDKDTCKITVYQSGIDEPGEKDWSKKEFAHRSLAMKQTATWCGYCPRMSRALEEAYAKAPGEFEIMNIYIDGSDYEFDQEEILQDAFSIRGAPVGTIDGRRTLSNNKSTQEAADDIIDYSRETVRLYGTTTGISFDSSLNGNQLSLRITAYIKEAGAYKITAVLTESGIIGPQADYDLGSHSAYVHDNVARIGFTSILGDDFTISKDADERKFTYSATIPSNYVKDNLKIVVYIHRAFGDQTRVSDYSPYGFFNYYVDNLTVGKIGTTVPLAFKSDGSGGNEGIGDGGEIEW